MHEAGGLEGAPNEVNGTYRVRRVAMVSVHTSPLAQPGTGDAGGMNVYVLETSRELARSGIAVDVFTRRTTASQPDVVVVEPGLVVRHIDAGPYEGLDKEDLPGQLCAFAAGMMRVAAHAPEGHYDLVHSHYWLSGQVGWLAADRWDVPLVHTMHTMARVKNEHLPPGDAPEPAGREIGEAQVVAAADRLVANTDIEAGELVRLYDADPARVSVVYPGIDPTVFQAGDRAASRARVGLPADATLLLFVGRIQRLKAPDLLLRAAATLFERQPSLRDNVIVAILGGASGQAVRSPLGLAELALDLGIAQNVRFIPPTDRATLADWYRSACVVAVPSHNESFGLVAVEAAACGAVVVASDVGGLPTAVGEGGILIPDHDPATWASAIEGILGEPAMARELSQRAVAHAHQFTWTASAEHLRQVYELALRSPRGAPINDSQALSGIPTAVIP
ncbi:MAG: D-inositol-3-phosphate glycosyltransferase [Phycicoccus sp.]|nr:D-inositol-3-phosphate glycosyltransferase [Phycicoccus sp.]